MKIAFDEHVPDALYRVFDSLIAERKMRRLIGATGRGRDGGYTVVRSRTYNPAPTDEDYIKGPGSDVPWITKFAADDGKVLVSGNVKMMEVPQEVVAIQQAGIIAFYFESGWNKWNFFQKSSLLLWHWEMVVNTFKKANPGDVYRIPAVFAKVQALNLVSRAGQWEMLTESLHTTAVPMREVRRRLTRKRPIPAVPAERQGWLGLLPKK